MDVTTAVGDILQSTVPEIWRFLKTTNTILLISFFLMLWTIKNHKRVRTVGPDEWPIIGALRWVMYYYDNILDGIVMFTRQNQFCTWTIKWFTEPRYFMISDPDCVKHVLQDNFQNYPKGKVFAQTVGDLLGSGIFAADGEMWKEQRRVALHMFSAKEFRETIMASFISHGEQLDAVLEAHAASGTPFDIQALFFRFTLDSIGTIAFGTEIGSLQDPHIPFAQAFDDAQATVEHRFFTPGWRVLKYILPSEARLRKSIRVIDEYCQNLIENRRRENDFTTRKDVLSRFMSMTDDQTGKPLHLHNTPFLRDVILNFMIAGRDTTAQCLSWAVWRIASNPRVETLLTQEALGADSQGGDKEAGLVRSETSKGRSSSSSSSAVVVGNPQQQQQQQQQRGYEWCPTHRTIADSMPYARSVLHETLRLHPSVPKDMKRAIKSDTLPDGTYIPAGCNVVYLPYLMGRNPSLWGADAETFDPARWDEYFKPGFRVSPFKFIAFNAGPRTCLGQQMALVEAAFVLGLIYRKYKLVMDPANQVITHTDSLTLPMKYGLQVKVVRNRKEAPQ